MAIITNSIGSAGGRDYSTIAAWISALPANLVTDGNSYVGQCYNDSEFVISSPLTFSGHTTDSTHTITLTTGTGQSFRDNANVRTNALAYNVSNGVGIRSTNGIVFSIADSYVTINNLQASAQTACIYASSGTLASNMSVNDCILQSVDSSNLWFTWGSGTLTNCLIYISADISNGLIIRGGGVSGNPVTLRDCTIAVNSTLAGNTITAVYVQSAADSYQNVAIFGAGTFKGGGTGESYTTCMTDLSPGISGVTGGKTFANQFVATTNDFRTKVGADLIAAGTSIGGITDDISGYTRPATPTIGAWEHSTAAPVTATFVPPSRSTRYIRRPVIIRR